MDQAGTISSGHVVGGDDRPAVGAGGGALGATLRGVKVVVDGVVVRTYQLTTLVGGDDARLLAQLLGVGGDQV